MIKHTIRIVSIVGLLVVYIYFLQETDTSTSNIGPWQKHRNPASGFEETWTIEESNPLVAWVGRV